MNKMKTLIFTCRTITPLVMSGADGRTPELRPPGIKAALRFWWRSLHGHLTLDGLKKEESKLFGDTSERSDILVRVLGQPTERRTVALLEHKQDPNQQSKVDAFSENQSFKVRLDFNENSISEQNLKSLFIVTCALGGWGKRSRRGFGSIAVDKINDTDFTMPTTLDVLLNHIETVVPTYFKFENNMIRAKKVNPNYPNIIEIRTGNLVKTLRQISQVTHDVKAQSPIDFGKTKEYDSSLGAGIPRLASPVVVSILANNQPIITTLQTVTLPQNTRFINPRLQENFKNRILQ
jgi:CRISPR-associated protein Cmr1